MNSESFSFFPFPYAVVPQLSVLSLALCREVLEDLETIWSQKETSPLAYFVRNAKLLELT